MTSVESMKMKAGFSQLKPEVVILLFILYFHPSYQLTEQQVCNRCNGTVQNGTAVGQFCNETAGRIDGRCCWRNDNTSDHEHIIGLDLSNCSLTWVEDLSGASTALMIDLSLNPIVKMTNSVFLGFTELNYMILPQSITCPGGKSSWEKVVVQKGNCLCEGQKNMCNQTGQLSLNCPENSICAPYGPGFFECNCAGNHHGYKCLREGKFPVFQVFGPLWASTVLMSILLWVTQRHKAKSV